MNARRLVNISLVYAVIECEWARVGLICASERRKVNLCLLNPGLDLRRKLSTSELTRTHDPVT